MTPGTGPSAGTEDEANARAEILALLPTNASNAIQAMRNVLHDDGDPEELVRRELAELTTSSDVHVGSIADAIDPQITAEECAERGWPWKIFSACSCARVCMKRLAAHKPELLDRLIDQLQTARAQAEADSETPRTQRAFKILVRSVWSKPMVGAESETLQSLLDDEQAATSEHAARPSGPVEAAILDVNKVLLKEQCCRDGRRALLGCSKDYLSYHRKRGEAGPRAASAPRTVERLSVEAAMLADPCRKNCVRHLSAQHAKMFAEEFHRAAEVGQAEKELVTKRFMFDTDRGQLRGYCNNFLMSLVPIGRQTLARLRQELYEDGYPLARSRQHGLILWRQVCVCTLYFGNMYNPCPPIILFFLTIVSPPFRSTDTSSSQPYANSDRKCDQTARELSHSADT